ncbi:MAG: methyl-accepting chemotaxis protein [Thermodesulfobacteriota bacterium]|nr:methyl-accepting chemotaxis protein [Thermodesulfobacteriota bacterium]
MFKNLKLRTKIGSGFIIIIIMAAAISFVGYYGLGNVLTIVDKANDADRLMKYVQDCRIQEKNLMMLHNKKYKKQNDKTITQIYKQCDETMAKLKNQKDRVILSKVKIEVKEYQKNFNHWSLLDDKGSIKQTAMIKHARDFITASNKLREEAKAKIAKTTDFTELKKQMRTGDNQNRLIKFILNIRRHEKNFIIRDDEQYVDRVHNIIDQIATQIDATEGSLEEDKGLPGMLSLYKKNFEDYVNLWKQQQTTEQSMTAHVSQINKLCNELCEGQKSKMISISSRSKTMMTAIALSVIIAGLLLAFFITRGITKSITRIIEALNEGANQVVSASGQVSSASQSLAEGSSEQAASLEETSSSLEEIASMTKQNADNATEADTLMNKASQVINRANASMKDLTFSMKEISQASQETSNIIKTIDEIAFQTNLLALNAAVEAARAGEAGAGFAVVAEEVRNLAMRSAEAAKNTALLIEETVKKVGEGSKIVDTTENAFAEVASSSSKIGELVGEIAAASKEQANGVEQVNTAVTEMDKVTQQNAANAEESASASEEMNAQAEQMKSVVEELIQMVGSSSENHEKTNAGVQPISQKRPQMTHFSKKGTTKQLKAGEVTPDQIVAFDDDDDF